MPRGQKSKLRTREKRQQARNEAQHLQDAQTSAAEEEEFPSSPTSPLGGNVQSSLASGSDRKSEGSGRAPSTTTTSAGASCTRSDDGAKSQNEKPSTSQALPSTEFSCETPLDQKVTLLVQFLLCKHNLREPITKQDMIKHVIKKYKKHFNEILRKASNLMVLAFGIEVKEVNPATHCYALVSKFQCTSDDRLRGEEIMPKTGLLMTILCVIFMKGNCATEEDVWEVLNVMGIYAGRRHFIHGDPKKLITKDLVQERYLEYRQVPNSDPPRYEILWGPRAHAEISKMKVLEFLANMHDTVPSAFPSWYEEALRDEEERARARFAAMFRTSTLASVHSGANGRGSFSHL